MWHACACAPLRCEKGLVQSLRAYCTVTGSAHSRHVSVSMHSAPSAQPSIHLFTSKRFRRILASSGVPLPAAGSENGPQMMGKKKKKDGDVFFTVTAARYDRRDCSQSPHHHCHHHHVAVTSCPLMISRTNRARAYLQ